MFLLISESFATSIAQVMAKYDGPANSKIHNFGPDISKISLLLFFLLFIIGIIKVIMYNKKMTKIDSIEERKKFVKCVLVKTLTIRMLIL